MIYKKKKLYEILFVVLAGLVASIPLLLRGIDAAPYQDLAFHLSRIEGIKEGLLAGKFPVMLQSVWMNGKGYPVSVFYGDALLYFPALLRIVGVPVIAAYKIYVLSINIGTALVAFFCFADLFKNRTAAMVGALLYVTASYRLLDIYVRNAAGEYTAFLFFPIIAMAMGRILRKEIGDAKEYMLNSLWLCLGMSGLVETHLLSSVMAVVILTVLCIFYAKRSFRPRTLFCIGLAAVETVVINLYYIVPFADYYLHEPVYAGKGAETGMAMQIREYGAFISQYFSFFAKPFGVNAYELEERMQLTIGLPLMLVLFGAFVYFVLKDRKYKIFVLGALAFMCLLMSSNLFPWNTLEGYTHLFKFLSKVQFPWRYLAPAAFITATLFVHVYSKMRENGGKIKKTADITAIVLVCTAIVMTVVFTVQYKSGYTMANYKNYSEVDSGYMGACEYLNVNVELSRLEYEPANEGFEVCEILSEKDNTVVLNVVNDSVAREMEVLKLYYTGCFAKDENGNRLDIKGGYNDFVTVTVPAGFSGKITVGFAQPVSWIFAETVSFLSVILVSVYLVLLHRKKAH